MNGGAWYIFRILVTWLNPIVCNQSTWRRTSGPFSESQFLLGSIKPVKLCLCWLILSSPRGRSLRNGVFNLCCWKETSTPNLLLAILVLLNPQRRLAKLHRIIVLIPRDRRSSGNNVLSYYTYYITTRYSGTESLLNLNFRRQGTCQ